jgi:hypothetical protein
MRWLIYGGIFVGGVFVGTQLAKLCVKQTAIDKGDQLINTLLGQTSWGAPAVQAYNAFVARAVDE